MKTVSWQSFKIFSYTYLLFSQFCEEKNMKRAQFKSITIFWKDGKNQNDNNADFSNCVDY